mgnify:CR=1 FL=1
MKTYYLTLSKVFPSTHAKAGMNTCFEEKLRVYKLHTIRANYDFWKKRFEHHVINYDRVLLCMLGYEFKPQ